MLWVSCDIHLAIIIVLVITLLICLHRQYMRHFGKVGVGFHHRHNAEIYDDLTRLYGEPRISGRQYVWDDAGVYKHIILYDSARNQITSYCQIKLFAGYNNMIITDHANCVRIKQLQTLGDVGYSRPFAVMKSSSIDENIDITYRVMRFTMGLKAGDISRDDKKRCIDRYHSMLTLAHFVAPPVLATPMAPQERLGQWNCPRPG